MTHYSPVVNLVTAVQDLPQDEWIALYDRTASNGRVELQPLTSRQQHHNDRSSPVSPLLPGPQADSQGPLALRRRSDHNAHASVNQQTSSHKKRNKATTSSASAERKSKPWLFLDKLQNGWLWEVLGLVMCLLSFGAIVGIVYFYSDQRVPHFSYGITVS